MAGGNYHKNYLIAFCPHIHRIPMQSLKYLALMVSVKCYLHMTDRTLIDFSRFSIFVTLNKNIYTLWGLKCLLGPITYILSKLIIPFLFIPISNMEKKLY